MWSAVDAPPPPGANVTFPKNCHALTKGEVPPIKGGEPPPRADYKSPEGMFFSFIQPKND